MVIDNLYTKAAEYHGISVPELYRRIVAGETLIHQYRTQR